MSRTRRTLLAAIFILVLLSAFVLVPARSENLASGEGVEREQSAAGEQAVAGPPGDMVAGSRTFASSVTPETEADRALEALRRRIELARSGSFYLVLDPGAGTLMLSYRSVTARTWPVTRVEIGGRRILFVGSTPRSDLGGTAWTAGRLVPARTKERPLLEVDSQGTPQGPEPPLIPPTPEEAVPAPPSYLIRFEEGLTVEIVAGAADPRGAGLGADGAAVGSGEAARASRSGEEDGARTTAGSLPAAMIRAAGRRLRDARDALAPGAGSHPRLRLVLPPAEAGSLYRSLQDGIALVIG